TAVSGCDSIIVTTLTLNPVYSSVIDASICPGSMYLLPDGSSVSTAGSFISNLITVSGCDSIITTNLSVSAITTGSATVSICPGSSATLPDGTTVTSAGVYTTTL